ncbi:conserved hypothetical protein [Verrucomicrobia bacterium]|nr:conserved hypothetical protein [Verrucomicrobiota bacterium]
MKPDPELLNLLCCPETHQAVRPAPPALLEQVNLQIASGTLKNRAGRVVKERLDDGLLRADGKLLYPLWQDIPVMLVNEAIPL